MNFYQVMQLGPEKIIPMIKNESDKKLKKKYIWAFISKNLLCTLFCILVVSFFSKMFGSENSSVGVVTVILILSYRFGDLDMKIGQSAFALWGIFVVYAICPYLAHNSNPFIGFIINSISIISIIVIGANNRIYANHVVLSLSYFLLYGNSVTTMQSYYSRVAGLMLGGAIVGLMFYMKNRKNKEKYDNSILDVIKSFDIRTEKSLWQLKLALGVSSAVLIGELLHLQKTMWIAFACMSVIQQSNKEQLDVRCKSRMTFITLGCIGFTIIYTILPKQIVSMIPILAGIMVGFCDTYERKTIMNNFSALPASIAAFGAGEAIIIRIVNNVFGALYSKAFDHLYYKLIDNINNKSSYQCEYE